MIKSQNILFSVSKGHHSKYMQSIVTVLVSERRLMLVSTCLTFREDSMNKFSKSTIFSFKATYFQK